MPLSERLVSSTSCACPPPTEAGSVVPFPQDYLDSVSAITHHNQPQEKMQEKSLENPDLGERSVIATFPRSVDASNDGFALEFLEEGSTENLPALTAARRHEVDGTSDSKGPAINYSNSLARNTRDCPNVL